MHPARHAARHFLQTSLFASLEVDEGDLENEDSGAGAGLSVGSISPRRIPTPPEQSPRARKIPSPPEQPPWDSDGSPKPDGRVHGRAMHPARHAARHFLQTSLFASLEVDEVDQEDEISGSEVLSKPGVRAHEPAVHAARHAARHFLQTSLFASLEVDEGDADHDLGGREGSPGLYIPKIYQSVRMNSAVATPNAFPHGSEPRLSSTARSGLN